MPGTGRGTGRYWRENVRNPVKPVIAAADLHAETLSTQPLTQPGEYKFTLVVFDGEYASLPQTVSNGAWHGIVN